MLVLFLTFWLGFTPEQLWSLAVDPSGQRGETDTQYLLAAWSSTDTDTSTSDSNLWMQRGRREMTEQRYIQHLLSSNGLKVAVCFAVL